MIDGTMNIEGQIQAQIDFSKTVSQTYFSHIAHISHSEITTFCLSNLACCRTLFMLLDSDKEGCSSAQYRISKLLK